MSGRGPEEPGQGAASPARLLAHCRERLVELDRVLEALVRESSGSDDRVGNRRCLEVVAAGLASLGMETTMLVTDAGYEHLLARRAGREGAPVVLMLGHSDTVFEARHRFRGYWSDNGKVRGPGVADMKGGLVTMIGVVDALVAAGQADSFELRVFVNSDEEQQSRTSRQAIRRLAADANVALVFEAGRPSGALVGSRRGTGRYLLRVTGRAAHAGNALEAGRNAIVELAHKLPKLHALTDRARGVSLNCGIVSGGSRANVVAESASVLMDVRCDDEAGAEWLDAQIRAIAKESVIEGCTTEVKGGLGRPPWPRHEGTDALLALWQAAARDLGLEEPAAAHAGGGSDANLTFSAGVPTLDGLGPRGGGYHTEQEWMELASVPERAALTALALQRWAAAWASDPRLAQGERRGAGEGARTHLALVSTGEVQAVLGGEAGGDDGLES